MIHTLERTLFLPIERQRVFAFFSDATNLARITPSKLGFVIRTPQPIRMAAGTVLDYRIRALGLPMRWRSLISRWDPPHGFVDEQLRGPYKQWIHTHRFLETDGGTTIEDVVRYELPYQPLGEWLHPLVARQLEEIFAFRTTATQRLLVDGTEPPAG